MASSKKFRGRWLTTKMLKRAGACQYGVRTFRRTFGERVYVTPAKARKHARLIREHMMWLRVLAGIKRLEHTPGPMSECAACQQRDKRVTSVEWANAFIAKRKA